jgi:uncharacterized protein YkwD
MKTPLLISLACVALVAAQETPALNMQHVRTAATWLSSVESKKRKAAISTFRTMPAEAMPYYKTALEAARKAHGERIKALQKSAGSLSVHDDVARQLTEERKRVMELVRTDFHKEGDKVRMLREEMQGLIDLYTKRQKLAKSDVKATVDGVNQAIDALCDISRELEKLDPRQDTSELDAEELRARVVKDSLEAEHLMEMVTSVEKSKKEAEQLAEAEKLNAENGRWCLPSMKSFATVLNFERAVIGLNPLRIEEKLSDAASGHSGDMAARGFFAHESPVPDKKTPWDRARLAQFDGNASGENIFMGSPDPQSAYNGWFGSDGHRFIMFSQGPNCCGIGVVGIHWTFMTGSKNGG